MPRSKPHSLAAPPIVSLASLKRRVYVSPMSSPVAGCEGWPQRRGSMADITSKKSGPGPMTSRRRAKSIWYHPSSHAFLVQRLYARPPGQKPPLGNCPLA